MIKRRNLLIGTLTTLGAATLVLTQTAGTQRHQQSFKLEGAWIAKVPGTPLQWTYVLTPDSSGRRASLFGTLEIGVDVQGAVPGLLPDNDSNTSFAGEVVMTGPDTAVFTAVAHSLNSIPSKHVVFSWVTSGEMRFVAPGKVESTHHISYYLPEADADGDGIPDEGVTPLLCLPPTTSLDTRVGLIAPCTP